MAVLTGFEGSLYDTTGVKIAHCRNWSVTVNRDALETTSLGDGDRTYVKGLRGTTGTATILYDPEDTNTVNLLNKIFADINCDEEKDAIDDFIFQFDKCQNTDGAINFKGMITSMTHSVSVGDVQTCNINFQASGTPYSNRPYPG